MIHGGKFRHLVLRLNILQVKKVVLQIVLIMIFTNSINHNFEKIRIDSFNSLPIEKIMAFPNVTILIKPDVNKNKNEFQYNIFLEKGYFKDKSNTQYF